MLNKIVVLSIMSLKMGFCMEEIIYDDYINSFVPLENELNEENMNHIVNNVINCPNAPKKQTPSRRNYHLRMIPIDYNNNYVDVDVDVNINNDNMDVE